MALDLNKLFDEFREEIKKSISIKEENCSKHGLSKHSNCMITDQSMCIECLKERRFGLERKNKNEN